MLRIKDLKNREVRKGNRLIFQRLESPLHSKRGVHREFVANSEIVTDFPLSTYAEVEVGVHTFHLVKVEPKLRFGDEHEVALAIYEAAIAPEVSKTASGEEAASKVVVPSSSELPRSRIGLLVQVLEHRSNSEATFIVLAGPSIGDTSEVCIVERELIAQATIVLYVSEEGRVAELEFARDFPVGQSNALSAIVHIHKEESVTPLVRVEHLNSGGEVGTFSTRNALILVQMTTEIVVELDVLRLNCYACGEEESSEKEKFTEHIE